MHRFSIHFTAEEPLVITDGTSEGMTHRALSYVPGTMLLGALAGLWKRRHGGQSDGNPEFDSLFVQGRVFWGHAVPVCGGRHCLPVPKCWQYVTSGGRLPLFTSAPGDTHAEIDNMLYGERPDDGRKRKPLPEGFFDTLSNCAPDVRRVHARHVALDPVSRRAQTGILFGFESIAAGTELISEILCAPEYIQALRTLLPKGLVIHVGHARSAGYGALRVGNVTEAETQASQTVAAGEHTLYFESDYFPKQSWKLPEEALAGELEKSLGGKVDIKQRFARSVRLEGFNSLWRLPRTTRTGIARGSVITFSCSEDGTLPSILGGFAFEGYGRVKCDPPFLRKDQKNIEPNPAGASPVKKAGSAGSVLTPLLRVWRSRTFERLAEKQAMDAVWGDITVWDAFFIKLGKSGPSQSQRGSLRRMVTNEDPDLWQKEFGDLLALQSGIQWKHTILPTPFGQGRETLADIMLKFLDREYMDKFLADKGVWNLPDAVGGKPDSAEEKSFRVQRHRRFLLELLGRWVREFRSGGND